jgi:hypothetical protein
MAAQKLQLKFFADAAASHDLHPFVLAFHGFIREKKLGTEVLIDVADYAHVHHGPGIVLIGHEGDYSMDTGEGRLGLLYNRKRGGPPDLSAAIVDAARHALRACSLLEADGGAKAPIRFATNELLLRINDRLLASNMNENFSELRGELESAFKAIYGAGVELSHEGGPKDPFSVRVKAPERASVSALLEKLGGPPS